MSKNKKKNSSDKKSGKKNKPEKNAAKAKAEKTATKKNKKAKADKKPAKKPATVKKKPEKKSIVKKSVKSAKPQKTKVTAKPLKKNVPASKAKVSAPKKVIPTRVKSVAKKPVKKIVAKAAKPSIATKKPVLPKKEIPAVKIKHGTVPSKPVVTKAQPIEKEKKSEAALKKAAAAERKNDVLAVSNTIPVKTAQIISPSKIASISQSITNPVRSSESYSIRPEKEPHGKYELEFVIHASADMLFEFLSTPSGLSEWFCDDVNIRNGIYTFIWEEQLQQARLLKTVDLQLVRFQWVDKTDGSYFEFRIQQDDLTNDISLIVTDFGESVSERESGKQLWNSQIEKLMQVIGSI